MDNIFYVYAHYKPNEDMPFYVGKGHGNRSYDKTYRNRWWHNIVNKYGYRVEIMYDNLTEAQAFDLEKEFIKRYGRADLGCGPLVNMTDGGDGASGAIVSNETRSKLSKAKKSRIRGPLSEEHKRKLSNFNSGKILSEETKQKISNSLKGKPQGPLSKEHKQKLSIAGKKRIHTHETKQKISKSVSISMKEVWCKRKEVMDIL